jgi:hypothetical protein
VTLPIGVLENDLAGTHRDGIDTGQRTEGHWQSRVEEYWPSKLPFEPAYLNGRCVKK